MEEKYTIVESWIKELEGMSQSLDQILSLSHDIPCMTKNIDRFG